MKKISLRADVFGKFKESKVETEPGVIYAPVKGNVISLEEIPDPVFAQGIVGLGCGIEPEEGEVVAPFDGKIVSVTDTKHALGIQSNDGIELLIHVGMDTVQMKGEGFVLKVKEGEQVHCGQLLMKFDIGKIQKAGFPATTAVIVTNAAAYEKVEFDAGFLAEKTVAIGHCGRK